MRPSEQSVALADRYRLALSSAVTNGAPGERLGGGTGSSLEFQDRRNYSPGDDVRHLDWRVYARTGELFVRLYREEITPRIEVFVDGSRSMAAVEGKAQRAIDLAGLIEAAGRAEGLGVHQFWIDDTVRQLERAQLDRDGADFTGSQGLSEMLPAISNVLRQGAARFVVSDFLFPHDPNALVRSFARGAGSLIFLRVLGTSDVEPERGALRLRDAEDGGELDLILSDSAISSYRSRLDALTAGLSEECRRMGAVFCDLSPHASLDDLCREQLVPRGVLVPA